MAVRIVQQVWDHQIRNSILTTASSRKELRRVKLNQVEIMKNWQLIMEGDMKWKFDIMMAYGTEDGCQLLTLSQENG